MKESNFIECILAPGFSGKALRLFQTKKNLRVLKIGEGFDKNTSVIDIKKVSGGMLLQVSDEDGNMLPPELNFVTGKKPSREEIDDLLFAWEVVKHVKSNAIVIAKDFKTVGIGAGQMSRVDSVYMAVKKSEGRSRKAVLASDAFFPMPDSVEYANEAGISSIIQPGGSIKDDSVIEACNKFGISMVFTGKRYFKH